MVFFIVCVYLQLKSTKKMAAGKDREPFDIPTENKRIYNKKKNKPLKLRLHIYLTRDCLDKVDEVADELGLDRSPCLQMLINVALKKVSKKSKDVSTNPY